MSFLEGMPNELLLTRLLYSLPDSVDYAAKTVDFQNDDMKRILQLTKKYGVKEIPKDEGEHSEYGGEGIYYDSVDYTDVKFQTECLAVKESTLSTINDFAYQRQLVPGQTAFLGYPSTDGTGMSSYCFSSLGIVATTKYADLAWDFIRSFLQFSYDGSGIQYTLSVNRKTFEKECEDEMNRNNALYEKAMKEYHDLSIYEGYLVWISREDIDTLRELMSTSKRSVSFDSDITAIICEEAAGYFAGDRSEEDVLKTIQNRASMVVKEK